MDSDLQTLRRRAASTDAPNDRAALLRARVRAGELAVERLWLPAFLGDEASRLMLGPQEHMVRGGRLCCCGELDVHHGWGDGHAPVHSCEYYGTTCDCVLEDRTERRERIWPDRATLGLWIKWARERTWWTQEVRVRALIPVAHLTRTHTCYDRAEACDRTRCTIINRAIHAAEAWVVRPVMAAQAAADRAAEAADGIGDAVLPAWAAARIASGDHPPNPRLDRCALGLCKAADLIGEDAVRQAVARELIPWALGERDPVAERVAARG